MITASAATVIAAPPCKIWEMISDPEQWDRWMVMHGEWPDGPPAGLEKGTQFRQRLGHLGIYDTVTVKIVENDLHHLLVLFGQGNYGADARFTFQLDPETPDSTRVTTTVEILGKLVRPLSSLVKFGLQKNLRRTISEFSVQWGKRTA